MQLRVCHSPGERSRVWSGIILAVVLATLVPGAPAAAESTDAAPERCAGGPDGVSGRDADARDSAPVAALPVSLIEVVGHESLSSREVEGILGGESDAPFDPSRLEARADSLLAALALLGRPLARVEITWSESVDGVHLAAFIREGPEVRLGRLTVGSIPSGDVRGDVRGDMPDDVPGDVRADVRERAAGTSFHSGAVVTRVSLEAEIEELLSSYENEGYPFVSVVPGYAAIGDDGRVEIGLAVDTGLETRFGDIVVSGNAVTKDHVVRREVRIKRDEPYSETKLSRVRPRLERLGIFESVAEPLVAVDPLTGEATIGVEVSEGPANRIAGVLGYRPGVADEDGEITGLVEIELGNIAGTGRQASVEWENLRTDQTQIAFSYREPWLLGAPVDVGIEGAQTIRDTFYTTTEGDLFVTARMGDRTLVTWSVGAERYVPEGESESTTTSSRTALVADFDGTDAPANPTRGILLRAKLEYASKEKKDTGDQSNSATLALGGETFLRIRPRHVIAVGGRLSGITSGEDEVPFHELLVLGGATSLRGYREEQFRGTRTALGTLEYRVLLDRKSRVFVFVDVGYFFRDGRNSAKDTKLGYGIGLRGQTRLGIIGVDYGLGEGDGLLDGKLHVGLIREF
jgi:outer membrane protein insertion porin family